MGRASLPLFTRHPVRAVALLLLIVGACAGDPTDRSDVDVVEPTGGETAEPTPAATEPWDQEVEVRLDGEAVADALVLQGGSTVHRRTDAAGRVVVRMDPAIPSPIVVAAHPEARTRGVDLSAPETLVVVELTRFSTEDNESYVFQDPGTPTRDDTTAFCSHCHVRQVADWIASPHATAASNPVVHDVYLGTASRDEAGCAVVGGLWRVSRVPGGGTGPRCRLPTGTLPDLDPGCTVEDDCAAPSATGGCADCHAPGIDGALGGRDLLEATGIAHDHGVHCDVCHKVAGIDLDAPAGVAGRLQIVRPVEDSPTVAFDWAPLTFGPIPDVLNVRMGAAHAPVFEDAVFCAGCHQLDQAVLLPDAAIDTARWPSGRLPVHSTYEEWRRGPLAEVAPCQACHMPPDPEAGNSADVDLFPGALLGRTAGWWRPPGASRRHTWSGPRGVDADLLALALEVSVDTAVDDGTLTTTTTVRHRGPGHAVPTGEPSRSVVLHVDARCDGAALHPVDGPAIPDVGGLLDAQPAGPDLRWPGAEPGQVVRVVRVEGWRDDPGFGPFGDGTFAPEDKGLPDWRAVGASTILSVDGDGRVTLDAPLPDGDLALLGEPGPLTFDAPAASLAGAPGMVFARVLVDPQGTPMVPHHRAVDMRTDNRLLPGQTWTASHAFDAPCDDPEVVARLAWRQHPVALARERGWDNPERRMGVAR